MTEPASRTRPDHYSYAIYADPAMADSFDRARFSGPVGELLAETQARILTEFCGPLDGRDAIDVGTGTARAALVLAGAGAHVTAIDASSVTFRQEITDPLSTVKSRDVRKSLYPSEEGR